MSRFRIALAALAPVTALGAGMAFAQPAQPPASTPAPQRVTLFERIDTSKDGKVTMEELKAFVSTRFAEVDANKDGAVTLEEAQEAMAKRRAGWQEHHARRRGHRRDDARRDEARQARQTGALAARFRALDANSDGKVTMEELEPVIAAVFRAMDANGDGAVVKEELRWMPGPMGGGFGRF